MKTRAPEPQTLKPDGAPRPGCPIAVAVVDDDEGARVSLKFILRQSGEFCCVSAYPTANDALCGIPTTCPALVLMDIGLPDMSGNELTLRLKAILPALKVVIVTGRGDEKLIDDSLRAGAAGYLTKPVGALQCVAAMRFALARGATPFKPSPPTAQNDLSRLKLPITDHPPLNPLENEIMKLVSQGQLNKEIAYKLGLSLFSVNKHLSVIYQKLRAANRIEALRNWDSGRAPLPLNQAH